jgi:hypothetical protein
VRRISTAATIDYVLKEKAPDAKVEILDGAGALVRSLAGKTAPGHNRVSWDLRYPGATVFEGMVLRSAQPDRGPLATPGLYQVRVTANGQSQTQPLEVRINPNLKGVSRADLEEQFKLAVQIRDKTSAAHEAVIRIRALKAQVADRLKGNDDRLLAARAEAFVTAASAVEEELYQVKNRSPRDTLNYPVKLDNRLAALSRIVESADTRPTDQTYQVFKLLSRELDVLLRRLEGVLQKDLPPLNRRLAERRMEQVALP